FEPSAANFHVFSRNVSLNRLNDRVSGYCLAFAGATELGALNIDSPALGSALNQFGKTGEKSRYGNGSAGTAQGMLGMTVDEFIERFQPLFPTYIKMDVDGLELPILQGAVRTLSDPRLRAAMIELSLTHTDERSQGMALLEAAGLKLVELGQPQGTETEQAA